MQGKRRFFCLEPARVQHCALVRTVDGRMIDLRKNDCLGSSCKKCGWNKSRFGKGLEQHDN